MNSYGVLHKDAADWTSDNTYLKGDATAGQQGIEDDTGKSKLGPGYWNDLSYLPGGGGGGAWGGITGTLTDQTDLDTALGLKAPKASPTFTGTVTLPTGLTGLAKLTSGVVSAASAGTDYYNPGGTDVAIADGGTGASTASAARTALGVEIGTDVQAHDADLDTIAGLTATTNNFIVSVSSAWASRTPTQVKATLAIAESDVTNLTTDLAAKQPLDSDLTTIAGLVATADNFMVGSGLNAWSSKTPTQAKTSLAITQSDVASLVSDLAAKAPLASPTFTGTVTLPTGLTGIAKLASGVVSAVTAPSGTIVGTTDTQALTNKRVTSRVLTIASSATPSINTDDGDVGEILALATNITSMTTNLTGTPTRRQKFLLYFKDDGTPRTIIWGASFLSSGAATLLATTVTSKTHMVGLIYDPDVSKFVCAAVDPVGY